jgi:uncharacterized membrane protein (UPF0136 family)
MAERTRSITNPWVVIALLVEVGTLVGYFRLAGALVLPVATLCGISLVIGAGRWALRGSWAGFLLVGVAVGVPGFMLGYPQHLALEGRPDRRVVKMMNKGVRANPTWLWSECINCNARFKTGHYGDGVLQHVDDDEWNESVTRDA